MKRAALLIEDNDTLLVVRTALECAGYVCDSFRSTAPLLRGTHREEHCIIVADLDAPGTDCASLLDWRDNWLNPAATLFGLGSRGPDAALALDHGMDDFVTKPVNARELLARLAAATRRRLARGSARAPLIAGVWIDRAACAIATPASRVPLTAREMAVAQLLFEHEGRIVSRSRLSRDVWGQSVELAGRAIEQIVYQLRRKLKTCAGGIITLRSAYGSGYWIEAVQSAPLQSRVRTVDAVIDAALRASGDLCISTSEIDDTPEWSMVKDDSTSTKLGATAF